MDYCPVCRGEGGKPICYCCLKKKVKRKRTQREKDEEIIRRERDKERYNFLSKMRQKLNDFNMESTGSKEVDQAIIDEVGEISENSS